MIPFPILFPTKLPEKAAADGPNAFATAPAQETWKKLVFPVFGLVQPQTVPFGK